jgi:hypothetical protein
VQKVHNFNLEDMTVLDGPFELRQNLDGPRGSRRMVFPDLSLGPFFPNMYLRAYTGLYKA